MQQEITTLTLNPTIDGWAETEEIVPFHKIRTSNECYSPGGGGINVARTILALGGTATAVYLAGGATGTFLRHLLDAARLPAQCVPIAGNTRIAHTFFERSTGSEYRFVPEGPTLGAEEWTQCVSAIERRRWDYLVLSGSEAPGAPENAYAMLARLANERGARLVLDSSGDGLRSALDAGVYLVKPSLGELEEYVGAELEDEKSHLSACQELIAQGRAKVVALTFGGDGALLVSNAGHWRLRPPPVEARSAVGAGDSFVGAMTLSLARGLPIEAAFAYGVAAGSTAVVTGRNDWISAEAVERLFRRLYDERASSEIAHKAGAA